MLGLPTGVEIEAGSKGPDQARRAAPPREVDLGVGKIESLALASRCVCSMTITVRPPSTMRSSRPMRFHVRNREPNRPPFAPARSDRSGATRVYQPHHAPGILENLASALSPRRRETPRKRRETPAT